MAEEAFRRKHGRAASTTGLASRANREAVRSGSSRRAMVYQASGDATMERGRDGVGCGLASGTVIVEAVTTCSLHPGPTKVRSKFGPGAAAPSHTCAKPYMRQAKHAPRYRHRRSGQPHHLDTPPGTVRLLCMCGRTSTAFHHTTPSTPPSPAISQVADAQPPLRRFRPALQRLCLASHGPASY
jgi:hypothetical protein